MPPSGISGIVAAVLLVTIAVASAALIYLWLSGSLEIRESDESGLYVSLKIDSYKLQTFSPGIGVKLYVHNLGSMGTDIDAIYADNTMVTSADTLGGAVIAAVPEQRNICVYLILIPSIESQGMRLSFEVNASVLEIEVEAPSSNIGLAEWSAYITEISVYPIYPHFALVKEDNEIKLLAAVAYYNGKWSSDNVSIDIDLSELRNLHSYNITEVLIPPNTFKITWYFDGKQVFYKEITISSVNYSNLVISSEKIVFRAVGIDREARAVIVVHSVKAYVDDKLVGIASSEKGYEFLKPMYVDSTFRTYIARADRAFTMIPGEKIHVGPYAVTQVDVFIPKDMVRRPRMELKVCSSKGVCVETTISTS